MRVVLALAQRRRREGALRADPAARPAPAVNRAPTTLLWELAERYHPEEAWLAESHVRGERSFDELARTAPRGALSPSFLSAVGTSAEAVKRHGPPDERHRPAPSTHTESRISANV